MLRRGREARHQAHLCPPSAGVASALGLLVAPARVGKVSTIGFRLIDGDIPELESVFKSLKRMPLAFSRGRACQ